MVKLESFKGRGSQLNDLPCIIKNLGRIFQHKTFQLNDYSKCTFHLHVCHNSTQTAILRTTSERGRFQKNDMVNTFEVLMRPKLNWLRSVWSEPCKKFWFVLAGGASFDRSNSNFGSLITHTIREYTDTIFPIISPYLYTLLFHRHRENRRMMFSTLLLRRYYDKWENHKVSS